jgi:DNA polymerase III subunit epsilon
MKWLARLLRRPLPLDAGPAAALAVWRDRPAPDLGVPFAGQRALVVDVEASGLDPFRDRLISIGAVGVLGGAARLDDSFDVVLRQPCASDDRNIPVHGIGGSAQTEGHDPAEVLVDFLAFSGKAPLVAFHSDFDRVLIERTAGEILGVEPAGPWLDLAVLAPALFAGHARSARSLDDWLAIFGIENDERHDALADAVATAQLLLVVLAEAGRQGLSTWLQLDRLQKDQRWLARR